MIKIIICCSQGMSSSVLVRKMKEYIKNANLDASVKSSNVSRVLSGEIDFDILLLGPQIRAEKKKLQNAFPEKQIDVIEMVSYGRLDGESVVKKALSI